MIVFLCRAGKRGGRGTFLRQRRRFRHPEVRADRRASKDAAEVARAVALEARCARTSAVTDNVHPSRDAMRPSFANHHAIQRTVAAPRGRRSAERRNANHLPRNISKRRRLLMYRRQVYAVCATHLLRGCAPFSEARSPSGASTAALAGTPIPAQLQAMLPGTRTARDPEKWIPVFRKRSRAAKQPAGVTRPILSQSSDSTSRLGRNTEGNDAQSRPGAGCKPARRHRTRSASESALAKASLDERDDVVYLI